MTTFVTVQYVATDAYGDTVEDLLPIEEIPDKPPWYYAVIRPFTYRKAMQARKDSVTNAMDKLFALYQEQKYTKLTAKFDWDVI